MLYKTRWVLLAVIAFAVIQSCGPVMAQGAGVNRDSVAVVIGNRTYKSTIDVDYAHNDAKGMRDFLIEKLGFRRGNIIFEPDATKGVMEEIFGDAKKREGRLWNWVRNERSNVFVYYSGHGAPDLSSRPYKAYLIPTDGDPDYAHRGYSRDLLEQNLKLVKQKIGKERWLVLMLDACFTGTSGGGGIIKVSLPGIAPQTPEDSGGIIRINATSKAQVANWDDKLKHGLLTGQFLVAAGGAADRDRYGDRNGHVTWPEITAYVEDRVSYLAKRRHGREQSPEISSSENLGWRFRAGNPERDLWRSIRNKKQLAAFEVYLRKYPNGEFATTAHMKIRELTPPPASPPPDPKTIELAFWNSIKDSNNLDVFKSYLNKFPHGDFVEIARLKIREFEPTEPAYTLPPRTYSGNWFVILGSYPKTQSWKANDRVRYLNNRGYRVRSIDTNDYSNLTNGLYAVVMGPYSKSKASRVKTTMRRFVSDAYIKRGN